MDIAVPRAGKYLFKRKGSQNWWLRIQHPKWMQDKYGVKREISMGTPDYQEAEIKALPYIQLHKQMLFLRRHLKPVVNEVSSPYKKYQSDIIYKSDDGESFIVEGDKLKFFDKDNKFVRYEENENYVDLPNLKITGHEWQAIKPYLPKQTPKPNSPNQIIENWIHQRGIGTHLANEARTVARKLEIITGNIKSGICTRDQAKKLVKELELEGNKSATIEKKIGHLRAAVNIAIDDGILAINPFNKLFKNNHDRTERLPLSDIDMDIVRHNLSRLSPNDQLLWKFLASTGMRLNEPFEITEEFVESGVRFVIVGTKTKTSKRRVPLPESIISYLPTGIEGRIFFGSSETAGKRLRYLLRTLHISFDSEKLTGDNRKVVHSLRHRAADKLRTARCPDDIRHEILGHEEQTVARGYGLGYPVSELKFWIDQIGL